ncbi:MAG: immune inhibitor A [Bacteroidetes bacterium]|nr:immune inhibitor A [Bacteroidota bacterium]
MKKTITICLLLVSILFAQETYKKVKIFPSQTEGFRAIAQLAFDLEETSVEKDGTVRMFLNSKEFGQLQSSGLQYEVLIEDWNSYYNSLPKLKPEESAAFLSESRERYGVEGFGFGSMGGFYTFQEAINQLDSLHARFPNLITQKFQIGETENGRPIWAAKISDNPNSNEDEPRALFDGLIHAREPISMMTVLYYMYYLCENYGTNPEVTYLVNNREIFFVPVVNPDGYEYNRSTNPNGGGMWRKNRRNSGNGNYGVDLNRNFGYMWGYDNTGSSPEPSSETYRGPSAFSEPEVAAIRNISNQKNFKTYINFHSFANAMLYPWGYINQVTPDNAIYSDFCSYMTQYNRFEYGNGGTILGYNSNGSSRDWFYGEQTTKPKSFGYTFEIGGDADGFWPAQSRIFPLVQLNLRPLLFKSWVAGEFVSLFAPRFDRQYFNPGETVTMRPLLKNRGLSPAAGVSVELVSLSQDISVVTGSTALGNLASMDTAVVAQPLSFFIGWNAGSGVSHKIVVKTVKENTVMSQDTLLITLGVPNYIFLDTTGNPLTNWTVTATPGTSPKWEATTTSFVSSPVSFTDSKTGNYIASATVTMTTTNPVSLQGVNNPKLEFWLKYDIESNYDYAQVMISTNGGSSFTALQGKYTEMSTGSFQPPNQPVYDGSRLNWVKEEVSLLPYAGQQVLLRFRLVTDNTQQKDGIYLDDIGIVGYSVVPVELTSLTASINSKGLPTVKWEVASELNNKGFIVERRTVETGWEERGFVPGRGTSQSPASYAFEDNITGAVQGIISYRIKQIDFDGSSTIYGPVEVESANPAEYALGQNYPNPFNPVTRISYTLPVRSMVKLEVFDATGQTKKVLVSGEMEAGWHFIDFESSGLTSGVYLYRITAGNFSETKKMLILK